MGGPSSESGNSSSSFGSGIESDASSSAAALKPGTYDDEGAPALSFEAGVFGVLYTVSKEKAPRLWFVIFRLFLDWLQLFLLIVNPSYGWAIDPSNKVWQAFSFIQLNYFMTARGYLFFLVCLYTMSGCLVTNLALCIWVSKSFQANKFDHVWPIAWLKVFSLVFYQVLDIASLTLFLIALDCQYFAVPASALYHNQQFPDVYCWSMPHLAHAAVAAVSVVVFTVLAAVFTGAEVELNPVSKNLLGMAHSQVEVMAFLLKSLMTCASVFVNGMTWLSVVYLICSFFLVYLYLTWLPYLHAAINHVRIAAMTSILYASLLLIIMSYAPGVDQNNPKEVADFNGILTNLLWAGLVPVTLAGAAMSYIHTRFWAVTVVNKFREAPPDTKLHRVYPFTDPRQVEIASRCCRQWLDEDTLDEEAGRLAERIILAGKKLMPHQPYMTIWYSSFLIDVQGSYQSGYTELQLAKKATNPTYLERFCMFIREQEHTQRASAVTSGENGSVDLVSYVEFQRNLRLAVRMHMDALLAMRNFWETLLHANITFDKLSRAVARIETCVRASERMYRTVLSRHSSSVKVLQLYVKFLQGVRNDPWSAARWAAEAEKLQKMEEEANERAVFGGDDTELGGMSRNDDTKGIIIMGANCLIRMINDAACELVGYQYKSELMGKNINAIVPPPFSRNHNNYVRNYIQTGQSKVLDKLREFVVLHKERYVRPISVFVTKVSGIGEDSVFMGVFQPIHIPPNTAVLWVLMSGQVLSCDITFTDWTGYKQEDLTGKPITEMVQQPEELERTMMYVRSETEARQHKKGSHDMPRHATTAHSLSAKTDHTNLQALVCGVSDVSFKHLYTDELLTVDAEVKIGGISETALWVITLKRAAPATSKLMVTDSRGRILHVTQALADCLGTTPAKLQLSRKSHALDTLLPAPFTRLHHQWYQSKAEVIPPWSCRSGLSVYLPASSPAGPFMHPVSLHFTTRELPGKEPMNVVAFQDSSFEQVLDERRLRLLLDSKGRVLAAGDSSISLFNLDPQALVGLPLTHILDVLRPKARDDDPLNDASAASALMDMANRSFSTPGLSWRVGVAPIMDPDKLAALGPIGMAMIARKTVPAIMTVEPHLDGGHMEGASVMLPAEMHLMVELWRADLLSGVLELDTQGNVVQLGVKEQPIYSPHLLLGYPASMLQGAAISALLPTVGKAHLETLFTEGSMGKALGKPGVGRPGKGGMAKGGFHRRRAVGPLHHVKLLHGTDGAELELQVQAVVKQDVGAGCALYLIVHLEQPRGGRADFMTWLWGSPPPVLHLTAIGSKARRRSTLAYETTALDPLPAAPSPRHRRPPAHGPSRLSAFNPLLGAPDEGRSSGDLRPSSQLAPQTSSLQPYLKESTHGPPSQPHSPRLQPTLSHRQRRTSMDTNMEGGGAFMSRRTSALAADGAPAPAAPSRLCMSTKATVAGSSSAGAQELAGRLASLPAQHTPGDNISTPSGSPESLPKRPASDSPPSTGLPGQLMYAEEGSQHASQVSQSVTGMDDLEVMHLTPAQLGPTGLKSVGSGVAQGHGLHSADSFGIRQLLARPSPTAAAKASPRQALGKPVFTVSTKPAADGGGSDSDRDSGGVTKDGNKERVHEWMSGQQGKHGEEEEGDSSDSSSSAVEDAGMGSGEESGREDKHRAHDDQDASSENDVLDEAASTVNDFKRGKRLKRLAKTLTGPLALLSISHLKVAALVVTSLMVAVDLAMFITFLTLANVQSDQVLDLQSVGLAIHHVLQVAISVTSLESLYAGAGVPHLRYLGEGGAEADIAYQLTFMEKQVEQLDELHRGVYLGFNKQRRLTEAYGIRDIWESPSNELIDFYPVGNTIVAQSVMTGLWDGGNTYIKQARDILQNSGDLYGLSTGHGVNFTRDPNTLSMLWNGPHVLVPAYMVTLDGLMQQAIADSQKVNNVQLIILAIEGGVTSCLAIAVMWYMSKKVVFRRYAIFMVFLLVPHGLIKALAARSVEVEEGSGEDNEENGGDMEDNAGDDAARPGDEEEEGRGRGAKGGPSGAGGPAAKLNITALQALAAAKANRPSLAKRVLRAMMFWKGPVEQRDANGIVIPPAAASLASRRLVHSQAAVLWLVWPFIVWALFVIVIASIGFVQLAAVSSPIATSNLAQFVKFRSKSVMFYSQRLVSGQYIDITPGPVTALPYPLGGTTAFDKQGNRDMLRTELLGLQREYEAMLYGREAPLVAGDPSPHFQLATQGVMFAKGADVLYTMTGCMALNPADCLPPDNPFYPFVHNGLDQALKQLIYSVQSLLLQVDSELHLGNEAFHFIYECGNVDVTGGLSLLNDQYNYFVQGVYHQAVVMHIITFVVCWVVCAGFLLFILRPTTARITAESRRIAELLSHLPPELDVEALVAGALKAHISESDPQATIAEAVAAKAEAAQAAREAREGGGKQVMRRDGSILPAASAGNRHGSVLSTLVSRHSSAAMHTQLPKQPSMT